MAPTPPHAAFWDVTTRFVIGSGIVAGVAWYVTPYFGPALAAPSKKEEESYRLNRRFSSNNAMAPLVGTKQPNE